MKKLTSVLLSMVMLMSVLCMPTLAAGQPDYLNADTFYDADTGIVELIIKAATTTTNGKFTVTFDDECLSYSDSELDGMLTNTVVDGDTITMSYATSTENAIHADETIAVLHFVAQMQTSSSSIDIMVFEFNDEENLRLVIPTVLVPFPSSIPVLLGDVNGDGVISSIDLTMLHDYAMGWLTLTEQQLATGDTNSSGSVTVVDLTILYDYLMGWNNLLD